MAATHPERIFAIACIIMLLGLSAPKSFATTNDKYWYRSIDSLMSEGRVSAGFMSTGGYSGYCVEVTLENQTGETVYLGIEAGRRLIAADSTKQDILIVKENKVILAPLAKVKTAVYGFCCQSHDGAPTPGMRFSVGYMADAKWVRLARFLNTSTADKEAMQSAVWVLSNKHSISSIHGTPLQKVQVLRDTVGGIIQMPVPWYSIVYESAQGRIFSGIPQKVYGKVTYYLKHHSSIVMVVKDKKGNTMKTITESRSSGEGRFECDLAISVEGWPKGAYDIVVYEDHSNPIMTKRFVLE